MGRVRAARDRHQRSPEGSGVILGLLTAGCRVNGYGTSAARARSRSPSCRPFSTASTGPASARTSRSGSATESLTPGKIHDVPPVYPPAARAAGIEGLVLLEATIGPAGEVSDVEVLRSVPELDQAAIDAVEQWRWEPTLVDGEPVSILMTVTINFMLPSR